MADRVYIADKPTLDEIKIIVQNIETFSNYNMQVFKDTRDTNGQFQTILNIAGKGNLFCIASPEEYIQFKITIDGSLLAGGEIPRENIANIPLLFGFNNSLKVEVNSGGRIITNCIYYNLL